MLAEPRVTVARHEVRGIDAESGWGALDSSGWPTGRPGTWIQRMYRLRERRWFCGKRHCCGWGRDSSRSPARMGETEKGRSDLRHLQRVWCMGLSVKNGALRLLVLILVTGRARPMAAADFTPFMGRPTSQREHFQGDQFARAGDPQRISPFARPTDSPHEIGYYMGGGARERSRRAEGRYPEEGVWGTDYGGALIRKHVELGWWHGRSQGGTGSYATDGPRVVRGR